LSDLTDHSHILFSSGITLDGEGCVRWQQGQYEDYWAAEKAINLATALLLVAGIALAEGNLSEGLLGISQDLEPGTEEYKVSSIEATYQRTQRINELTLDKH
jgi:hypothetical protein